MTLPPVLRFLTGPIVATVALALAWAADLPKGFGAHPWWSTDVLWMGGGVGILAGILVSLTPRWTSAVLAVLAIFGFASARWGGLEFAASYAENQTAGVLWYWGWLTAVGFGAAALTRLFWLNSRS